MDMHQLPQLRVLVTDYCDSKCIYCRPSGEGNLFCRHQNMSYETAINAANLYRSYGGREIKISGGDPVFWPHLRDYVHALKHDMKYEHVEVITRSVRISELINQLADDNLDVLNFSLDSICPEQYRTITGKADFDAYSKTIIQSAAKLYCKINMVILNGTTLNEIDSMIRFCTANGIRELKLLDYISDLRTNTLLEGASQAELFKSIYEKLARISTEKNIIFQCGFGHPMSEFIISDKFRVICKDASLGSWYSPCCPQCRHYPCHDAIMSLRVTPSDSFQLCLLNSKMHWKFDNNNMKDQFQSILSMYQNAVFVGSDTDENDCVNSP